ncbi:MAG: type II toxin-antitoxin system VapC family toxin [Acetobacteraceae bacterium]|nr:type II toxin-antitoxin system VapC family toxin [Acetobacteraceae bacterium]
MRLLLDTHALLWWLAGDDRLGLRARTLIEDPGNDIIVSVASFWEIVVKVRVGRLGADIKEIAGAVEREGFTLLDLTTAHLVTLTGLPAHHRDPFDHVLIAQAIAERATFVSGDRNSPKYPVQLISCSDAP